MNKILGFVIVTENEGRIEYVYSTDVLNASISAITHSEPLSANFGKNIINVPVYKYSEISITSGELKHFRNWHTFTEELEEKKLLEGVEND